MSRAVSRSNVILVDESDRPIGQAPKLRAHQNGGQLHRAFSIFIVNSAGQMLMQRRSGAKYHFGGLWSNACCSHPRRGERLLPAARRRLREEFGFDTPLRRAFSFIYRAVDPVSGLTEHEFDHVLCGQFDGEPKPNPEEIDQWKWMEVAEAIADAAQRPGRYTPWFRLAIERVAEFLEAE
jgi:isopentenyl-diphosphate delta-isomerase